MNKFADFNSIADLVKKTRYEKNYSQDHIAKKLGITQKAYSKIENNETKLNVDTLTRIAEILEVDVASFFIPQKNQYSMILVPEQEGTMLFIKTIALKKLKNCIKKL